MGEIFCRAAAIGPEVFMETILPCLRAQMGEKAEEMINTVLIKEGCGAVEGGRILQALRTWEPGLVFFAPPPPAASNPGQEALAAYFHERRKADLPLPLLMVFWPDTAGDFCREPFGPDVWALDAGEAGVPGICRPPAGEGIPGGWAGELEQIVALAIRAAAEVLQNPSGMRQAGFSPRHQAIMFGLLARGILAIYGRQRGEPLLERAVARYGNERGSRMARRALQNGDPLDMISYFAYGEWSWSGDFTQSVIQKEPYYVERVYGCPWQKGWEESGLGEFGRYYCRGIDAALLQGFHPGLRLEMPSISGGFGCSYCEFHWKDAVMTPEAEQRQQQIGQRLGGSGKRDFVYHTAHLYATLIRCAVQEDEQAARQLVRRVWQEFAAYTSWRELWQVLARAGTDFTRIEGEQDSGCLKNS